MLNGELHAFTNTAVTFLVLIMYKYNIKTAYDEKYGAPNAATPKVFMKYFFVNTKTGEKSGEMLASVALKADAGE